MRVKEIRSWWKRYFSRAWRLANDRGCEALNQGRYAEAEDSLLTALEEAKNFEPEDPRLGISLDNLTNVYNAQGKYAEAERLYQRALAIVEKALGPEHLDVAVILNNLASVYYTQAKYAKAERLYQRALAIVEKALGPEHLNVAASLENYTTLLRDMNRETEAVQMEARAKAIREKAAQQMGCS